MFFRRTIDQSRLNYEKQNQHKIRIKFSNQFEITEEIFLIHIEDVNEPPHLLQCSNQTGFCTVLDEDFNQTLKFNIKSQNETHIEIVCTDNGQSSLSVSTWIRVLPDDIPLMFVPILSLIIPVDDENNIVEKQTRDNFVILYSNDGDKTDRQRRQANSPPQDIYFNMFYLSVPENSRDFDIADVYVVDEDNDNYTCTVYTYEVPEEEQPFEIVNGVLQTSLTMHNNNYDLDFETQPVYNITVTCTDPIHHFTISKNFSIDITDVNEAPVELTIAPNTLPENSPAGYVVGQLHTIDPDLVPPNQTFEYTIVMDPNNMFKIQDDKLILKRDNEVDLCLFQPDLCPHDYEQITTLLLRIRVEDYGQPRAANKFWIVITLTDENDPPVNLQLDDNTVKENSLIGTLIGSFSVQDEDAFQTHTFTLLNETSLSANGNLFFIEDNSLRLARSPDYEQEQYVIITVQATDNGTIPKSTTSDFIIEIIDIDELPNTFSFISNTDDVISNDTINDLINGRQPVRTVYLPQQAYFQSTLGKIVFIMKDRDRDINLNKYNDTSSNELAFSKPTCKILTEIPYRSLCTSIVTVANPHLIDDNNNPDDGHLVIAPLVLTSNNKTMTFPRPLRIKFENITLTINNKSMDSIDILKTNATDLLIGSIDAIDLAAGGLPVLNITLNPNSSLSFPLEIVNSTILKVRDGVNLSSLNFPSIFNVSVLVTTAGDDSRIIEKHLIVNIKDKKDFNLTLSNNKVLENSYENTFIGNFIIENGIGNYTMDLINDAQGRFKLNGTNLLTAGKYVEHCYQNHTCLLDHEKEPTIKIKVAVRDPSTNQTLRLVTFSIEVEDINEPPYNLTLSAESVPEKTTIGSTVGFINALDDDFNQTLNYTTDSPSFTIVNNRLILKTQLNYHHRQSIPITIRATDNGQPSTFTEKLFIINVTTVNRPPINVTSSPMTVYISPNSSNTSSSVLIIGQIRIIDPDIKENFTITFNNPNFLALTPATNSYALISDNGSVVYAQVYNVTIVDLNPPNGEGKFDYLLNVTANITDSGNHSISHEFFVRYVSKPISNFAAMSTIPPMTTTTPSLSQALHIRIYENTPGNTPIVRGLLSSSSSNDSLPTSPSCTSKDDQGNLFPINTSNSIPSTFIILLPNNYTLNSTIRPRFMINVQCHIANGMNVNQDIVIDVLPAPPPIQIKFDQTKPFYATNNINYNTILGTFYPIELTTKPTNRTYNLSLINNQDLFNVLSNGNIIQIGSYSSDLLKFDDPYVNLTIQATETTPNEPTRIIQTTFRVPIIVNSLIPSITFNRTFLHNDTNRNTIIGNFTIHNRTTSCQLQLIDSYDNGLELDQNTNSLILKRPINTFPLINNQTQLSVKVALVNETNGTILITTFALNILYPTILDSCLNKDCGNGTCISLNDSSSYCLCTGGYIGIDCRRIDPCAYNPCINNGECLQLSSQGDFSCQCLPNYSGSLCEIPIDICQLNTSSCPSSDICMTIHNNLTNFFICISRDKIQYLVFDYLNDHKNIEVMEDENLKEKIEDFIKKNLLPVENIILAERRKLGPYKYDRAELMAIGIQISNKSMTTLNEALGAFCINQSLIINSFTREICSGYHQSIYLDQYFKSTPKFCPNCTFTDAADKYYWFDKTISFLPLWITLIIGTILMTAIPLIPFNINAPKKVTLPLMKAIMNPEDEEENPVLIKSVRSAVKFSDYSSRERNDSGYESNEDTENYLEQIITNHQQQYHVYPILHGPRSPSIDRRGTIVDDSIPPPRSSIPRRYTQRSASMSAQKIRRQSSIINSQTLKPIIHRRSAIFDSSIESLIRLTGTPRLNNEDETYVSTRFRNENTSKFVIGTLWNTFALVNNLFLQRPRKRRNAIFGETNLPADQLAHLQELYTLAELEQANESSTNNLQSIIKEILVEKLERNKINNLQSIIFDILSSTKEHQCTCYGNHHVTSCSYYDHSLPFLRSFNGNISQLEHIFDQIQRVNKPNYQDAATQSFLVKPARIFTHVKSTNNVATQSSPIIPLAELYYHVSTQCSPTVNNARRISIQPKADVYDDHIYVNVSTQFSPIVAKDIPSQFRLEEVKAKNTDASTQFSPTIIQNIFTPEIIKTKDTKPSTQVPPKPIEDIQDRRNSLMSELKQVISSSPSKEQTILEEKPQRESSSSHTVRSLVSMFETTSINQPNLISRQKSSPKLEINNFKILTPPESTLLNIVSEETQSSIVLNTLEEYANEVAVNIVDNAILTATTTTMYHSDQLQRRFSLYNNAGGLGKSLLFQSNTFVPSNERVKQPEEEEEEEEENKTFRAASQASSTLVNDPITTENESQHTLIVGRYVDGDDSHHLLTRKSRSLILDSSSSSSPSLNDEPIDHRHFLSISQLFSAQELYIRPWLVRRSTAPDIHCLTNEISDTRVEPITSITFFTIFPSNTNLDMYTRYTCLVTILIYLRDVHDQYSNRILYDQLDQLEKQFPNLTSSSTIHSNVFKTINLDGSKRYRTGLILDLNSLTIPKLLSKQIDWKHVKIVVRRFRKKYQHYKQLMRKDKKKKRQQANIENYLKDFDSISKRRIKKYAQHYAEKI